MESKLKLFDYQERCVQDCLDYLYGDSKKPSIVVAPTASGKSLIISNLAQRYGKPCLVLQPSKELLEQNLGKLRDFGGDAEVYSASMNTKNIGHLTYATMGSIKSLAEDFKIVGVETVFIDECHFSIPPEKGSMFMIFMSILKPKKVIGFTATPFRLNSSMEGSQLKMLNRMRPGYFKEFIHVIQVHEIIAEKRWSPLTYEYYDFDETALSLNSTGAEFTEESMRKAIEVQGINNNIYVRIKSLLAEGRKGILVFMDCLANAKKMAEHLKKMGICNADFLSSDTNKKDRERIIKSFKSGKTKVITNYNILSTGFDYPELDVVIFGRPTNSLAVYYQIIGRGTRVHPSKKDCIIADYCNNLKRFGKVENLVVEDVPGWGWGVTNNDIVLTNVFMGSARITKKDIIEGLVDKSGNKKGEYRIWFGKYEGKLVTEIPISYIRWTLLNWDFKTPRFIELKKVFVKILEAEKEKSFI